MIRGSINSIETLGTLDGPGLRTVIFFNGCALRCKYCHNPETWHKGEENYTVNDLVNFVKRYKPYYKNNGGVTISGGEPLIQSEFLIQLCKSLKEEGIHVALDTAGYGGSNYEELLKYVDLIIFDIKDINANRFKDLTSGNIFKVWEFLEIANKCNKKFWVRQVIVPGIHDNEYFLKELNTYIKTHFNINNIDKIEFLPYKKIGLEKYQSLGIEYPFIDKESMNDDVCSNLYNEFMKIYNRN